jgi:multidrug efflux pump subunit AcrA (membrane-fusion protein)
MFRKKLGLILVAVGLLAVSGVAYGAWKGPLSSRSSAVTPTPAYQTSAVRRADLSISVIGSGKIVASQTVDLSFPVSGKVATLNVQLGDQVKAGDVLAILDGLDELKLAITNQQLAVETAQKNLDDLQSNAAGNLAAALAAQLTAQKDYDTAKANVHYKGDNRCGQEKTVAYLNQYLDLKWQASPWENYLHDPGDTDYGHDFILENLVPLQKARDIALANYNYCAGFTDLEIASSQADFQAATAKLEQAKATYAVLQANNGIDPDAVQIAQATLKNAQLQLKQAQDNLAGATLVAPAAGTVTVVNGTVGSTTGTTTFITLAEMDNPQVQVNIDESDMQNFAVGCPAKVSFTASTTKSIAGTVTEVSPELVVSKAGTVTDVPPEELITSNSATYVQGLIQLDKAALVGTTLPLGLDVSATVTCHQSLGALEIPTQALYEPAGQSAYVYVLDAQGNPVKRDVVVGLKVTAFVEIKNGLSLGENVVTTQLP